MNRTWTAFAIVLLACLVIVAAHLIYNQSKEGSRPSFEIVSLDCKEVPEPYGRSNYQVMFQIENKGTGDASYVEGIMKYEKTQNKTWRLFPDDYVLKPDATSGSVFLWFDEKPTDPRVEITVECEKGDKAAFHRVPSPMSKR